MESHTPISFPYPAGQAAQDLGFDDLCTELIDEMDAGFARMEATIRAQTYWMMGTMITLSGVLAALIVICD